MNCDELANVVAPANARFGWLGLIFQILRGQTNGDERINMSTVADSIFATDDAGRIHAYAIAKFNLVADNGIRADVAVSTNASFPTDNGGMMNATGMDSCGHYSGNSEKAKLVQTVLGKPARFGRK